MYIHQWHIRLVGRNRRKFENMGGNIKENTMDTKTIIVTLVCAVLGSSALTAVVNAVVSAIQKKRGKATSQDTHLAEIDKKLGKMQEHQDEQYLAILRLTIMSEEMPMAERLIAGEKYKKMGGNGDVKKFLHQLEAQCERNGV